MFGCLLLSFLLLSPGSATVDCGIFCEDTELIIPSCEVLESNPHLVELAGECPFEIRDAMGNLVPNPIPKKYICETLLVYNFGEEDTCVSVMVIRLEEGPVVTPSPIENVSAQAYNSHNVPHPHIETCIDRSRGILVTDYTDEFISICNQVPRVVRTWTVTDKCGNMTTVQQAFDIISDIACTIIGPSWVPIGAPTLIKSQDSPRGLQPYIYEWSVNVLSGDGKWSLNFDKEKPQQVTIFPEAGAGSAELILDLFDILGCKKTCIKVFSAFESPRNIGLISNATETITIVNPVKDQLEIFMPSNEQLLQLEIVDLSGRTLLSKNTDLSGSYLSIPVADWANGLYLVNMQTTEQILTKKIVKD